MCVCLSPQDLSQRQCAFYLPLHPLLNLPQRIAVNVFQRSNETSWVFVCSLFFLSRHSPLIFSTVILIHGCVDFLTNFPIQNILRIHFHKSEP